MGKPDLSYPKTARRFGTRLDGWKMTHIMSGLAKTHVMNSRRDSVCMSWDVGSDGDRKLILKMPDIQGIIVE